LGGLAACEDRDDLAMNGFPRVGCKLDNHPRFEVRPMRQLTMRCPAWILKKITLYPSSTPFHPPQLNFAMPCSCGSNCARCAEGKPSSTCTCEKQECSKCATCLAGRGEGNCEKCGKSRQDCTCAREDDTSSHDPQTCACTSCIERAGMMQPASMQAISNDKEISE
jgi:hypothetical protein